MESLTRYRNRPPVAEPFSVEMEMWRFHHVVVRITMRTTAEIQPNKHHDLPAAILIVTFSEIEP